MKDAWIKMNSSAGRESRTRGSEMELMRAAKKFDQSAAADAFTDYAYCFSDPTDESVGYYQSSERSGILTRSLGANSYGAGVAHLAMRINLKHAGTRR